MPALSPYGKFAKYVSPGTIDWFSIRERVYLFAGIAEFVPPFVSNAPHPGGLVFAINGNDHHNVHLAGTNGIGHRSSELMRFVDLAHDSQCRHETVLILGYVIRWRPALIVPQIVTDDRISWIVSLQWGCICPLAVPQICNPKRQRGPSVARRVAPGRKYRACVRGPSSRRASRDDRPRLRFGLRVMRLRDTIREVR